MLDPPDWLQRGWIGSQPWNDMPVDMGELVPEEFVIDLFGPIDLGQSLGNEVDVFDQLRPFVLGQLKELRRMAFEEEDGPAWEELIFMQINPGEAKVCDETVCAWPVSRAGCAGWIGHGRGVSASVGA